MPCGCRTFAVISGTSLIYGKITFLFNCVLWPFALFIQHMVLLLRFLGYVFRQNSLKRWYSSCFVISGLLRCVLTVSNKISMHDSLRLFGYVLGKLSNWSLYVGLGSAVLLNVVLAFYCTKTSRTACFRSSFDFIIMFLSLNKLLNILWGLLHSKSLTYLIQSFCWILGSILFCTACLRSFSEKSRSGWTHSWFISLLLHVTKGSETHV